MKLLWIYLFISTARNFGLQAIKCRFNFVGFFPFLCGDGVVCAIFSLSLSLFFAPFIRDLMCRVCKFKLLSSVLNFVFKFPICLLRWVFRFSSFSRNGCTHVMYSHSFAFEWNSVSMISSLRYTRKNTSEFYLHYFLRVNWCWSIIVFLWVFTQLSGYCHLTMKQFGRNEHSLK